MNFNISQIQGDSESASDSYDAIIYQLFQPPRNAKPNSIVLAFTSVNPGEGVTYIAESLINSAETTLATRAIKVDMKWLKSRPRTAFREDKSPGRQHASAWMSGWEQRRSVIEQLRANFQIAAIDCPALRKSPDILSLASLVDGVVLIVEANRTRNSDIRDAESRIEAAGGNIVGLILNKVRRPMPSFLSKWFGSNRGNL